jgi:tyrosine-protein phosphatase YwqE
MFSIFRKKTNADPLDFSALKVDMHSHLIPGIDDGAPDLDTALNLIKELQELGFKKIITTPHVMADLYPNTSKIILNGLEKVRAAIAAAGIEIEIDAAAEYLLDEAFEHKLSEDDLLTLPGKKVLVEMSFVNPAPNLESILFELQMKGYRPIMAHPERYQYYHNDFGKFERLIDRGCELQVNLLSLTGYYGAPIKKVAQKLLKADMVSFLGTDLHNDKHLEHMKQNLATPLAQVLDKYDFKNQSL